jgi:hypothetical protein
MPRGARSRPRSRPADRRAPGCGGRSRGVAGAPGCGRPLRRPDAAPKCRAEAARGSAASPPRPAAAEKAGDGARRRALRWRSTLRIPVVSEGGRRGRTSPGDEPGLNSHREFLAPLAPPRRDHGAARAGPHAHEEPVGAPAPPIVGLIGPLHKKRAMLGVDRAEVKGARVPRLKKRPAKIGQLPP